MCADVQGGVIKYLFLQHLFGLFLGHLPLHEMEWRIGLLHLDWAGLTFLLVED